MRPSGRNLNDMRPVSIEIGVMKHAEGSCLIKMWRDACALLGHEIEDKAPPFLKNTGLGLGDGRIRDAAARHQFSGQPSRGGSGQAIGADAGNPAADRARAAGGRGSGSALARAADRGRLRCDSGRWRHALCVDHRRLGGAAAGNEQAAENRRNRSAIRSLTMWQRCQLRDLCGSIDCWIWIMPRTATAGTDGNFILTGRGRLIEVQMSAEGATFSRGRRWASLLDLVRRRVLAALVAAQKAALGLA